MLLCYLSTTIATTVADLGPAVYMYMWNRILKEQKDEMREIGLGVGPITKSVIEEKYEENGLLKKKNRGKR